MQESKKSRLIVFSRLWAIPMVLFVLLSIGAVIAAMNGHKNWMGLAVVGTVLMLIIQLAQLVSAITVRRWWCVTGAAIGVVVSLFVAASSIVALAAGQWRAPDIQVPVDSSVVVPDTISFSQTDGKMSCKIVTLVPDDAVKQAVGEWLNEQFGKTYTGDMTDIKAMVDFYGKSHLDSLRSIFEEGVPDYAELCYDASMEYVFETEKVVTYELTIMLDLGGAHPTTTVVGATFNKGDGKQLTWDIVRKDCHPQLLDITREMLKDYFNAKSDDELMEYLQIEGDLTTLPLPTTPPYMTLEGITLIYQQYEIAPYAAGMPCGIISYERIRPCLTDYAQELVPEDYSFPVKCQGKTPTISDFLVAVTTQEDPGEWMDFLGKRWTEYRRGDHYEGQFTVDDSKGYVRYDEKEEKLAGNVHTGFTEFRCWKYEDDCHYVVATACNIFENGELIDGQSSGITMYLYDTRNHRMMMVKKEHFGVRIPEPYTVVAYSLHTNGKDITATVYDTEKRERNIVFAWNGYRFDPETR